MAVAGNNAAEESLETIVSVRSLEDNVGDKCYSHNLVDLVMFVEYLVVLRDYYTDLITFSHELHRHRTLGPLRGCFMMVSLWFPVVSFGFLNFPHHLRDPAPRAPRSRIPPTCGTLGPLGVVVCALLFSGLSGVRSWGGMWVHLESL